MAKVTDINKNVPENLRQKLYRDIVAVINSYIGEAENLDVLTVLAQLSVEGMQAMDDDEYE